MKPKALFLGGLLLSAALAAQTPTPTPPATVQITGLPATTVVDGDEFAIDKDVSGVRRTRKVLASDVLAYIAASNIIFTGIVEFNNITIIYDGPVPPAGDCNDAAEADGRVFIDTSTTTGSPQLCLCSGATGWVCSAQFGDTIDDTELTAEDFGSWTCSGAEDGCLLNTGSVTTTHILDSTIAAIDIGTAAVEADEIASDAVGAPEIAADAVGSSEIATSAVGTAEIADGAVLEADLNFSNSPTVNYCAVSDGSTGFTWAVCNTGSVAAPGSDTQVIFNDGGSVLGADAGMVYDKTTDTFTITSGFSISPTAIAASNANGPSLLDIDPDSTAPSVIPDRTLATTGVYSAAAAGTTTAGLSADGVGIFSVTENSGVTVAAMDADQTQLNSDDPLFVSTDIDGTITSGEDIFDLRASGTDTSQVNQGVRFLVEATEDWTATTSPSKFTILTTPTGSATPLSALALNSDQTITLADQDRGDVSITSGTWTVEAGDVDTAVALFANGANCSAGQYPLGVDASGAVESCTAAVGFSTAGRSLTDAGGGTIDADQELYEQTKCINIDPAHTTTNWIFFKAERALTLIGIDCLVDVATSVVMTLRECDGNGANCGDSEAAITCTTSNTTEASSIDDAAVDAGDWLRVTRGTLTGSATQAHLCVTYTVAD